MSQKFCITELNNDSRFSMTQEISFPIDKDEVIAVAQGMDMEGEVSYHSRWYEIGEGESNSDTFISEEDLQELIYADVDMDGVIEEIEKMGYECNLIQDEQGTVECEIDYDFCRDEYEDDCETMSADELY